MREGTERVVSSWLCTSFGTWIPIWDCHVAVLMFANKYASGNRVHVVDILLVQGASVPASRTPTTPPTSSTSEGRKGGKGDRQRNRRSPSEIKLNVSPGVRIHVSRWQSRRLTS